MNTTVDTFQHSNELARAEQRQDRANRNKATGFIALLNAQRSNPQYVAASVDIAKKSIDKNYKKIGDTLCDPYNNKVLIKDGGNKLTTKSIDPRELKAMVDLAESKGWGAINVKGTTEFRKAVWAEAQSRGIEVNGYTPDRDDIIALKARIETQGHEQPSGGDPKTPQVSVHNHVKIKLVDYGYATDKNDPTNPSSPFVKLEQGGKVSIKKGEGLHHAVEKSGAVRGENVSISHAGEKTVSVKNRNGDDIETKRNEWNIKRDKGVEQADVAIRKLIGSHVSDPAAKKDLLAAVDRYIPKMQQQNNVPNVKVYDKRPEAISEKRQQKDQVRDVPNRSESKNVPSHSPSQ